MESNHEIGDAVWKAIMKLEMLYGRQSLRARMTGDVGKTSTKMGRETHGDENFFDSDGINWREGGFGSTKVPVKHLALTCGP